jgi:1-acyl-sn-glycerol-3-phosphate acyltransferase
LPSLQSYILKIILQRLYFIYGTLVFIVCMVTYTTCILVAVALISDKRRFGKIAYFFLRCWGYTFSTCTFIFYKVHGLQHIDPNRSYVFVCNHNSFLDGIAICLATPNDFRPLGKIELTKIPVFGWMYRHVVILVDRNSVESRQKSMLEMKRSTQNGISVLVFPEGTMNQTKDPLQPFKNGAFTLAIETQEPIVPMVMLNTKKCMPRSPKFTLRPGVIHVRFLPAVETAGLTKSDTEKLKSEVFDTMEKELLRSA